MKSKSKSIYKVPNRAYYNLEQAVNKIYSLTNEKITTDDLIYYWLYGGLEISTPIFIDDEYIEIADLHKYKKNNFTFIEYSRLLSTIDNPFEIEIEQDIDFSEFIVKFEDVTLFDKFPINLESLYYKGFFSITPSSRSTSIEAEIAEKGVFINYLTYLTSPKNNNGDRLKFYSDFSADFENTRKTYIPKDRLYILDYALYDFLNHNREFKTTSEEIQKTETKIGRPLKITEEIIELGRKIAKEYPTASANKIANAVFNYLTKQGMKGNEIPTVVNIQRAYRENKIGASDELIDRRLIIDIDKISI